MGDGWLKAYLPCLNTSLTFRPINGLPVTGVLPSADDSSTRRRGADSSATLWADPSVGPRGGDTGGAGPTSAAGRNAGAADPAPPTPPIAGGGFSPPPLILKAPPVSNGVDTLAFFTTGSATSFPFLFRVRGGMVGSSAASASPATSTCGASSGSGGRDTKIGHLS